MSDVITREQILASQDDTAVRYEGGFSNALDHLAQAFEGAAKGGRTAALMYEGQFQPGITPDKLAEVGEKLHALSSQVNSFFHVERDGWHVGGKSLRRIEHEVDFRTPDERGLNAPKVRALLMEAYSMITDACEQKAAIKQAFEGPLGLGKLETPMISGGAPAVGDPTPPDVPHLPRGKKKGGRE